MSKIFSFFVFFLSLSLASAAQNTYTINVTPETPIVEIGKGLQLKAELVDESGKVLPDSVFFYSRARRSLGVTREGLATPFKPGEFSVLALFPGNDSAKRVVKSIKVKVPFPALARMELPELPENMYAGTSFAFSPKIYDVNDFERTDLSVEVSSSNPEVAEVQFGRLLIKKAGNVVLSVQVESLSQKMNLRVQANPTQKIKLAVTDRSLRTGDVVRFNATALDGKGKPVDVALTYAFTAQPDDQLGNRSPAQVSQDGRFVANLPGVYTLIAKTGNVSSETVIRVNERNVQKSLVKVGHGAVLDVHTSDLWVWEGVDGRDYAVTGTWGANGAAYFWDVTNPAEIVAIDTVIVDARTVNDVKVSEDGRIAVLTREGASNRKNGIVILDVSNPREVSILSEFNDGLTGGVHNAFIYENHVFAVNNGRRYDIINIEDPKNPYRVSRYELDTPGHAIHDVWIEDGIAYSSNWYDGIVAVDVGGAAKNPELAGKQVGSLKNPVYLGSYAYPSGWNHAAFPFKSKSTGDFYVIGGDEAFPYGLPTADNPVPPAGWMHFVKFDGWDNPQEVARYEIPEAGTHNMWVKDDILYVAYYNAGLRLVDISGELMGNLYDQGREMARFEPNHPKALIPNAPFTWGPQPYKGHIFISDWNSGLWAVKVVDDREGTN